MFYFFIVCTQLLFSVVLYVNFRNRIDLALGADETRRQLRELVVAFNEEADRNISLLEEKVKEGKETAELVGARLERMKEMRKEFDLAAQEYKDAEEIRKARRSRPANADPLIEYFTVNQAEVNTKQPEKKKVPFTELSTSAKISYLREEKSFTDRKIARELGLAISEIELIQRNA
jgi:hypothetical protein